MLDRPIFVIGCGQSGTSILGRSLGAHPAVAYLHERRDLWKAAFPQTDVWSAEAGRRGGRIFLDERDYSAAGGRALTAAFATELSLRRRLRLCEKLPINAFRLRLIGRIFDGPSYVCIRRHGIDVARSIGFVATTRGWYGVDDFKWARLSELAEAIEPLRGIAGRCRTPFHRGLLEWVMSTAFTRVFFRETGNPAISIRYEALAAAPAKTLGKILEFCGLPADDGPRDFFVRTVRPSLAGDAPPPDDDDLTRQLLALDRSEFVP